MTMQCHASDKNAHAVAAARPRVLSKLIVSGLGQRTHDISVKVKRVEPLHCLDLMMAAVVMQ